MCLDRVKEFKPCEKGYKAMRGVSDGSLCSVCQGNCIPQPLGEWLDEKDFRSYPQQKRITPLSSLPYPIGWHICHSLQAAHQWSFGGAEPIVRVEVREPVATGYQGCFKVTVARKIKITSIVKEEG